MGYIVGIDRNQITLLLECIGYEGGYVRSPLLQLKQEEKDKLKEILLTAQIV